MKSWISRICKYCFTFFVIYLSLLSFIGGAAFIPKKYTKQNMLESAEYMCENLTQQLLTDWIHASQIDHYADCITLSIAYELDEKEPLRSSMLTAYYKHKTNLMNEMLLKSVREDLPSTTEYLRYWHGSAASMRILHLIWNVKEVFTFHAILMTVLSWILILLLVKNGFYGEAISYIISMIVVGIWYVPLCLEYTYTFLCMMFASIIGIMLVLNHKDKWTGIFFLVTGMVTVYFDFLTTETLSLLIPLLLMLRIWSQQRTSGLWVKSLVSGTSWLTGYLGMWIMKWITASFVLGENVMPYVTGHVSERLSGAVSGYHITGNIYIDTIVLNLRNLFPYEYGLSGAVLVAALIFAFVFIPVATGKVVLKETINVRAIILFAVLGAIPYVRYIVLHNHSYIHSFFTYRAQAASILALCFIILELVEPAQRNEVPENA